jgi:uncharacterized protein YoxC
MPVISFSVNDTIYTVLKRVAEEKGLTVTKLAKLVVEGFALHLHGMLNQGLSIGILNQRLSMPTLNQQLSDRILNQGLSDPIKNRDTDEAIKNPDTDSELAKRIEALEQKLDLVVKELRKQQDLINAYTGKADQVLQRFSQVVEAVEARDEKLGKVVELLSSLVSALRQGSAKVSEERHRVSEESVKKTRRERIDVCERLKKEPVIFESDIADRIRDRDKFFTKIARTCNGIVVEGLKERVAVEKGCWQQFLDKLGKANTSDEEKIKPMLDPLEFRLFTVLKESALIIFDANERRWKLAFKPSTTNTSTSSSSTGSEGSAMATGSDTSNSAERQYRKKQYEEDMAITICRGRRC